MSVPCEWLEKALSDLRASRILFKEGLLEESAFHSQQAVEKALKAILVSLRVKPPRTHSIEHLLALLEEHINVSWAYEEDLPALTYYAVEIRYPAPPVSMEEVAEALELAGKTVDWARKKLRELGVKC